MTQASTIERSARAGCSSQRPPRSPQARTALPAHREPRPRRTKRPGEAPGEAALPAPPAPPRLTSLPPCHSRCSAAGKPASASIRAFTLPTAAEGGSSKVLQPRQSWRTLTRANLRRHERHQLRRDTQRPDPAPPALRPPRAPRRPGTRVPAWAGGRLPRSPGEKEPLPQRRTPAAPGPARPGPPPLTCRPRHTKNR